MSEINARWERDTWRLKKVAAYLFVAAVPLWVVSFETSGPVYTMPQWQWFAAVSSVTLVLAIACSIATAVLGGVILTNDKPLPGSNY